MSAPIDIYKITDNKLNTFYFRRQELLSDTDFDFRTYDEYLKIFRVVSGSAVWRIEKKEYKLEKDDVFILNNTERRRFIIDDGAENLVIEYVQFLPIMMYPNQQCVMPFFLRYSGFSNKLSKDSRHTAEIVRLFDDMRDECERRDKFKNECIYSLLLKMLICIGRETHTENIDENSRQYCSVKNYEIISEAVRYITQHPYEDLSEDLLAKKFYISKYYFSHLFKFYNGMNLLTYVKTCRVNYALDLISNKKMDIADAAFSSGFGSMSGFYKAVNDVTGMSPGKFAKQSHSPTDKEDISSTEG